MDRATAIENVAIAVIRRKAFNLGFSDGTEISYEPIDDGKWTCTYHGMTPVKIDVLLEKLVLNANSHGDCILWGYPTNEGGNYIWVRMNDVKKLTVLRRD